MATLLDCFVLQSKAVCNYHGGRYLRQIRFQKSIVNIDIFNTKKQQNDYFYACSKVRKVRWKPRDTSGNPNPEYFITGSWDDKVIVFDIIQVWFKL